MSCQVLCCLFLHKVPSLSAAARRKSVLGMGAFAAIFAFLLLQQRRTESRTEK